MARNIITRSREAIKTRRDRTRAWRDDLDRWITIERATDIGDLLFKAAGVVAAIVAVEFLFFRPDVQMITHSAVFININALQRAYQIQGETLPSVVKEIATGYNNQNGQDLDIGANITQGELLAPALCRDQEIRKMILQVFPKANCDDPGLVLGTGRFYVRSLLWKNKEDRGHLDAHQITIALQRLQAAEYRKAKATVVNNGSAQAVNIRITPLWDSGL